MPIGPRENFYILKTPEKIIMDQSELSALHAGWKCSERTTKLFPELNQVHKQYSKLKAFDRSFEETHLKTPY